MSKNLEARKFIKKWLLEEETALCPESFRETWKEFWDRIPKEDKGILSLFAVVAETASRLEENWCKSTFQNWPETARRLVNYNHIIRKEKKDNVTFYETHDEYRDFIIDQLDDEQKRTIKQRLTSFYKDYPEIGIKHFVDMGDLATIKEIYKNAFEKMEEAYRYEGITDICKSIIKLIENKQYGELEFHYGILKTLGHARFSLGYFRESIDYYQKAVKIAIGSKLVECFGWIGVAYFYLSKYQDAINYLERALSMANDFEEDQKLKGSWLGCLANAYRELGLKEYSLKLYDEALKIAENNSDHENESRWLMNKGNAIREMGQSKEAMPYYQQALKIAEEIGNKFLQGRCENNIGNAYADLNQRDKAIEHYLESIEISCDAGDSYNESICRGSLGDRYNELRNFKEADIQYKKALKITMECKDIGRARGHVIRLLSVYKNASRLGELTKYLEEKLNEAKERKDIEDECFWLTYLAYVFHDLGQLREAKDYYKQALEIARQLKDYEYEGSLINLLDEVSLLEVEKIYGEGRIAEALKKCNGLIVERMGRKFSEWIKFISEAYKNEHLLNDLEREIEKHKKDIENNPSDSNLHMKLADCYARKGDLEDAILEYERAIELNPSNILTVLSMMEVTVWRKQYQEAKEIYQNRRETIVSDEHKLIATWVVCTALALDGQLYKDDIDLLLNMEIGLSKTGYSYDDILPYFAKLLEEEHPIDRLVNAWELHILIFCHFIDVNIEDIEKNILQGLPDELKKGLLEPLKGTLPPIDLYFVLGGKRLDWLLKGVVPAIDTLLLKAYMKRGLIHRMFGNLNMAIKDYIIATTFNPFSSETYMAWGGCLAQKGELEKAIPKYAKAIELNQKNTMAFLGKMEAEICLGRYEEAIATHKKLKEAILTPKEEVIAASLVCISLALDGKPYNDYINPLHNLEVKLSERHDWCNVEIDRHLANLEKEGYDPNRVAKAKEIQVSFKEHFVS